MFFDDWSGIGRVLMATLVAYGALIFLLRLSGKRTLAKMTAFDFVVTIAIGSVLANIALSKSTPFMEGMTAHGRNDSLGGADRRAISNFIHVYQIQKNRTFS
ncbi:hypothetical protein [Nitrosococcus oceani]|uniref:hypothetical protein n=1 Tax=Nitrosococcus oceani TaxID=1229 RepID=UPI000AEEF089|nr:hypothetical protein [Nitrosococcus oceani]